MAIVSFRAGRGLLVSVSLRRMRRPRDDSCASGTNRRLARRLFHPERQRRLPPADRRARPCRRPVRARATTDDPVTDTFLIRRLRPYLRGRLAREFRVLRQPGFRRRHARRPGRVRRHRLLSGLPHAGRKRQDAIRPRAAAAGPNIVFFERALPTSLVPNRDVGVQVLGDISGGLVSYRGRRDERRDRRRQRRHRHQRRQGPGRPARGPAVHQAPVQPAARS